MPSIWEFPPSRYLEEQLIKCLSSDNINIVKENSLVEYPHFGCQRRGEVSMNFFFIFCFSDMSSIRKCWVPFMYPWAFWKIQDGLQDGCQNAKVAISFSLEQIGNLFLHLRVCFPGQGIQWNTYFVDRVTCYGANPRWLPKWPSKYKSSHIMLPTAVRKMILVSRSRNSIIWVINWFEGLEKSKMASKMDTKKQK